MPRKRPGAIRAVHRFEPQWMKVHPRIDRLSADTSSRIRHWETETGWPGRFETALHHYREFLARPTATLYYRYEDCGCGSCELTEIPVARDQLRAAADALPHRPRTELLNLLAPMDDELYRRTLPDPDSTGRHWSLDGICDGVEWWHHRLYDGGALGP